jgi:chorismate mutase
MSGEIASETMDIADWRKKIDEIDRKLVELFNERAHAAQEIGRIKRGRNLPVYEPERERIIMQKICQFNQGPLSDGELIQVYERLIGIMRALQMVDVEDDGSAQAHSTGESTGSGSQGQN